MCNVNIMLYVQCHCDVSCLRQANAWALAKCMLVSSSHPGTVTAFMYLPHGMDLYGVDSDTYRYWSNYSNTFSVVIALTSDISDSGET